MKPRLLILILILLSMAKYSLCQVERVTQPPSLSINDSSLYLKGMYN